MVIILFSLSLWRNIEFLGGGVRAMQSCDISMHCHSEDVSKLMVCWSGQYFSLQNTMSTFTPTCMRYRDITIQRPHLQCEQALQTTAQAWFTVFWHTCWRHTDYKGQDQLSCLISFQVILFCKWFFSSMNFNLNLLRSYYCIHLRIRVDICGSAAIQFHCSVFWGINVNLCYRMLFYFHKNMWYIECKDQNNLGWGTW